MNEFDFIAKHLAPLAGPQGLGLKDDAALWAPPAGHEIVITQDTMIEGVHFPRGEYGAGTAEKLLRVNLSDLAAKGASPIGYTLSLSMPKSMDDRFLSGFAKGLKEAQTQFDIALFGGDTTRHDGPMVISATCFGRVPEGQMVMRSGAQAGNLIFVTGVIGDARLGLDVALQRGAAFEAEPDAQWTWEQAYHCPQPRLALRKALRKYASAALDVSDGLIADAQHLALTSGVQLKINASEVPIGPAAKRFIDSQPDPLTWLKMLITAGDDYEILGTVSKADAPEFIEAAKRQGVSVTIIGKAHEGSGVVCLDESGQALVFDTAGYTHF